MNTTSAVPITAEQRAAFDRDGYLIIRGALGPDEVAAARQAIDRVYTSMAKAGSLAPNGSMHLLSAVANCPQVAGLIDLDVHPPIRVPMPFRFDWHQDGGRQNRELEGNPRPRMSVKLAYWLSDVTETGRGNLQVVPGSHLQNRIDGPPRRDIEWPAPPGAIEVQVAPGDVVFFDRRLWHARSNNYSEVTRKAMFFGYTLRWIAIRDELADLHANPAFETFSPVQRQLLGGIGSGPGEIVGDHCWGHYPETTPLYGYLKERGALTRDVPALIP